MIAMNWLTTEQFVLECHNQLCEKMGDGYRELLASHDRFIPSMVESIEVLHIWGVSGLVDDYDLTHSHSLVQRRQVAKIVYHVMIRLLKEADTLVYQVANQLVDLYGCKTCVKPISQVYAKGIMAEAGTNFFDLEGTVSYEESYLILQRLLDSKSRVIPKMRDEA